MDIFSHALWGLGLFGYRGYKWTALFFGALPDLISFLPLLVIRIIAGKPLGKPPIGTLPVWTLFSYAMTHSLVISLVCVMIVRRVNKKLAFAMLAWPFHILIDFPFHTKSYLTVPIFWPVSDFTISGIHWSTPVVWYSNVAGLIILYLWRYKSKRTAGISA